MSEHTKTPWQAVTTRTGEPLTSPWVADSNGREIARIAPVWERRRLLPETAERARLFAAAPDLLAAAQAVMDAVAVFPSGAVMTQQIDKLRAALELLSAAISKAKGTP